MDVSTTNTLAGNTSSNRRHLSHLKNNTDATVGAENVLGEIGKSSTVVNPSAKSAAELYKELSEDDAWSSSSSNGDEAKPVPVMPSRGGFKEIDLSLRNNPENDRVNAGTSLGQPENTKFPAYGSGDKLAGPFASNNAPKTIPYKMELESALARRGRASDASNEMRHTATSQTNNSKNSASSFLSDPNRDSTKFSGNLGTVANDTIEMDEGRSSSANLLSEVDLESRSQDLSEIIRQVTRKHYNGQMGNAPVLSNPPFDVLAYKDIETENAASGVAHTSLLRKASIRTLASSDGTTASVWDTRGSVEISLTTSYTPPIPEA